MNIKIYLFLSGVLFIGCVSAQTKDLKASTDFQSLPEALKVDIQGQASKLLSQTTIAGVVKINSDTRKYVYTYRAYIKDQKILGEYSYEQVCSGCYSRANEKTFTSFILYCCKDPNHKPNETADTKDKMIAIQKLHHCNKIGICIE